MLVFVGISIVMQIFYGGLLPQFDSEHRNIVTFFFYALYILVCTVQVSLPN